MTSPEQLRGAAALAVLTLASYDAGAARGDLVVTRQQRFGQVRITGFRDGRLWLELPDGRGESAWIDEIDMILVDRQGAFEDFNEGERYLADGQTEKAAVRYRRGQRGLHDFWIELGQARLTTAYDRAGKIDEAVAAFVQLACGVNAPATAARLVPKSIPDRRDGKTHRALGELNVALQKDPTEAQRALLMLLRFAILRATGDKDAQAEASRAAQLAVPESIRSVAVYGIVHSALHAALSSSVDRSLMAALDRAIERAPEVLVPDFLILKGHVLLRTARSREDKLRAGWALMRVVAHMPDDPRAAVAAYEAARILEQIGNEAQAVTLLRECIAHAAVDAQTRTEASRLLDRLRSGDRGPG
jgi:tetratricopeptide (TPR) repeat protein